MKVITYSLTCDKVHEKTRTAIESQNIGKESRRENMSANKWVSQGRPLEGIMGSTCKQLTARKSAEPATTVSLAVEGRFTSSRCQTIDPMGSRGASRATT